MNVTAIQTDAIRPGQTSVLGLVDRYVPDLPDCSILTVSSKVISICEGQTVDAATTDKAKLIYDQADYYRSSRASPYNYTITIKSNQLIAAAGIDYADGNFVLWPSDPQGTANRLREYVTLKYQRQIGVIITDNHSVPLRRGTTGFALAHSGFEALRSYVGQPDVFGHRIGFKYTNVADAIAAAAVLIMGDGDERQPLGVVTDLPSVQFQDRNPSAKELRRQTIAPHDDLYAELLLGLPWDKSPDMTQH